MFARRTTTVRAFICQLHSLWTTSVHEFLIFTGGKTRSSSLGVRRKREREREEKVTKRSTRTRKEKDRDLMGAKEDEGLEIPGKKSKLQVFVETLDW